MPERSRGVPCLARAVVANLPISACDLDEAVATLVAAPLGTAVHLCNAFTVVCAEDPAVLRALLGPTAILLPDGTPLAFVVSRRAGRRFSGPVAGPELMRRLLTLGGRHFFYGASKDVLDQLCLAVQAAHPNASVVGTKAPPFGEIHESWFDDLISQLHATRPEYVWVALGTPKQDIFLAELARRNKDSVYIAVGAAFGFIAGTSREAPSFVRGSGLEWIFRLWSEPRRLWRRYLIGNIKFILLARRKRG